MQTIPFPPSASPVKPVAAPLDVVAGNKRTATAIVYCEANFGAIDGKTANGLVRHSERYEILSVIDSEKAGLDAGMVLDDKPNAIPIFRDLAESLAKSVTLPDYFIFGMAPSSGMLSLHERSVMLEAISHGMNIVNGLHEFLNDDPVFKAASAASNVEILDVRKPPEKKDLHTFQREHRPRNVSAYRCAWHRLRDR